MEVNNFNKIAEMMSFNNDDEFYFLQILQRPKDGNNVRGNNKNRLVKYYIIRSKEKFLSLEREIIGICQLLNARAYIHPTKRSFKEVSKLYAKNVINNFIDEHYHILGRDFSTACGQSYITKDKLYIIDIDEPLGRKHNELLLFIERECEPIGNKLKYIIPTKQGAHLIVSPFNVKKFSDAYPEIDVHKNNPTLLYFYKK